MVYGLRIGLAALLVNVVVACDRPRAEQEAPPTQPINAEHPVWLAISVEDKSRYRMGLLDSPRGQLLFSADYLTPFDVTYPRHLIVEEGAFEAEATSTIPTRCAGLEQLSSAPMITGSRPHGMFFTDQDEQFLTASGAFVRCVPNLDRCLFFLSEGNYSAQITIDRTDLCNWSQLDRALRGDMNSWLKQSN